MIAPDDRERLHDYLDGRLAAGERTRFERDLAAQSDLRHEFEALSALRNELASFRGETAPADLKDSILTALRTSANGPRPPRRSNPTMFLVTSALAAGLAIGVTVLYFASLREHPPAHLAVESAANEVARGKPEIEREELDKSIDGLRDRTSGSPSKDDELAEDARKPGSDAGKKSEPGRYGSRGLAPAKPADRDSAPKSVWERAGSPSERKDEKAKSDGAPETAPAPASTSPPGAPVGVAPTQPSRDLELSKVESAGVESKGDLEPVRVLRIRLPRTTNDRPAVDDLMGRLRSEAVTHSAGFASAPGDPSRSEGASASAAKSQQKLSDGRVAEGRAALEAAVRAHQESNPSAVIEHSADESWLSDFVTAAAAAGLEVSELVANEPAAGPGTGAISPRGPATGGGGGGGPSGAESKARSGQTTPGSGVDNSKAKGSPTGGRSPKSDANGGLAKSVTANDPPLPGLDASTWHWVALATAASERKKDARVSPTPDVSGLTGGVKSKPLGRERFVIVIVRDGD